MLEVLVIIEVVEDVEPIVGLDEELKTEELNAWEEVDGVREEVDCVNEEVDGEDDVVLETVEDGAKVDDA